MTKYTLFQGDCLEYMKSMPENSVDAVITDPPYFLPAQHYQTRKVFARSLSDLSILEFFFRSVFSEMARITKGTGVYYVFCDGQSYPVFFVCAYPECRRVVPLVWDKMVAFNGYSWRHQFELILFGERPDAPSVTTGDGDILKQRAEKVDDRDHPAQKPITLLKKLIQKSVPAGGIVFDPFMGSGTTGVACMQLEREFIGCELDASYYSIADLRLKDAIADPIMTQKPLFKPA